MLIYIILIIIVVAFVAALTAPLATLLLALHAENGLFAEALVVVSALKGFLADFITWLIFSSIVLGVVIVLKGRLDRGKCGADAPSFTPIAEKKIVVALTAYNDAEAVARVVPKFIAKGGVREVIVVDNNSTDDTALVAERAGARVVRESRQGYGYACIRGLQEALKVQDANIVVLCEADGTFHADDLSKFEAYIDQADMVVGSRVDPVLVHSLSQMDHFFLWGNKFLSFLLRLRFWDTRFFGRVHLTDVGCTYRMIRREALERIIGDLKVGGNNFSPHMLLVALAKGLRVVEIPVTFFPRIGESKGASRSLWSGIRVGLAMLWHIITYQD